MIKTNGFYRSDKFLVEDNHGGHLETKYLYGYYSFSENNKFVLTYSEDAYIEKSEVEQKLNLSKSIYWLTNGSKLTLNIDPSKSYFKDYSILFQNENLIVEGSREFHFHPWPEE